MTYWYLWDDRGISIADSSVTVELGIFLSSSTCLQDVRKSGAGQLCTAIAAQWSPVVALFLI